MKSLYIILLVLLPLFVFGQQPNKILLVNGFLHVGNGETVESALIGIEEGKISMIKNAYAYTIKEEDWDTIIELRGEHIYPGFVAPNNTLGLTEIDAVRATRDYDEVGTYNPHIRSQIAFNVESKVVSTVRTNGVLLSQATPRGGIISGTSAVMKLDGWNWEDATVSANDGIHLNWPATIQGGGWWASPTPKKPNEKYGENKQKIYDFFEMAKAYAEKADPKEDIRLAAMTECFKGEKRVYIHADELQQLVDVLEFSKHFNLKFPVIVGGYDTYLITEQLRDAKVPVMIQRPHSLPENQEDDVDQTYKLAALLKEGAVKFCIQNEGDMEAMNARNIPFLAGTAMAYGLSEEEAVRSVSLSACEIMGVDKNYGSIEVGKSATLFISKGSALEMMTNKVEVALIDGMFVNLVNFQEKLYLKYKKKYQQE
jgi:imidazolonepropionase-like amidohydrolase